MLSVTIRYWSVAWLTFWAFLGLKLSGAWAIGWLIVSMPLICAAALSGVIGLLVLVVLAATAVGTYKVQKARLQKQAEAQDNYFKNFLHG